MNAKQKLKDLIEDYACRPKQVVALAATVASRKKLDDFIYGLEIAEKKKS